MPNPNSKTKMTGDLHLPDVESDLPMQEGSDGELGADGTPSGRASQDGGQNRPGRGINKEGALQDDEVSADGSSDGQANETGGQNPPRRKINEADERKERNGPTANDIDTTGTS